jgi:hypothetical protein
MLSARTDLACVLLPIAVGNAMSQAIPYSDNQKKSLFVEAVRATNHMMIYSYTVYLCSKRPHFHRFLSELLHLI